MATVTDRRILQRQQIVLKFLGYYHGKCDGIWGPATTNAKREFELSGKFNPGYPNNGMPFNPEGPFPKGIIRDYRNRALITHVDITEDFIKQRMDELVKHDIKFDPTGQSDAANKAEVKVEVETKTEPKIEPTAETKAIDDSSDKSTDEPVQKPFERKHQHHHHKNRN